MVKHTQTIHRQIADKLFECVDHFVGLALKGLSKSIYLLLMLFALPLSTRITGGDIIIFDSEACFCMKDFRSLIALNISLGAACGASLASTWRTILPGLSLKFGIIKNFISQMVAPGNVRIFMLFRFAILYSLRPSKIESPIIRVVPFFREWFYVLP